MSDAPHHFSLCCACAAPCASGLPDSQNPVRGVFGPSAGRGGLGVCAGQPARGRGAVGAGPAQPVGIWGTLCIGGRAQPAAAGSDAGGGCAGRDGGRAKNAPCRRGRRNSRRSRGSGFHGNAAAGTAGRAGGMPLLADPACGAGQRLGGTQPLALGIPAVVTAPRRSVRSGSAALAGGTVSRAWPSPREMGGQA